MESSSVNLWWLQSGIFIRFRTGTRECWCLYCEIVGDFTRHLQRWRFSNAKRPRSRSGQSDWASQHFCRLTQDYPAQNQTLVSPHTSLRFCAILQIMFEEEIAPQVIWKAPLTGWGESPGLCTRVKVLWSRSGSNTQVFTYGLYISYGSLHTGLYVWSFHTGQSPMTGLQVRVKVQAGPRPGYPTSACRVCMCLLTHHTEHDLATFHDMLHICDIEVMGWFPDYDDDWGYSAESKLWQ